ncbi:MAG: fructosamine kinase family protein [Thermoleophilia bacterium]|nr:fructosamine kinase family protein [Thermoleophilia bacterium]
MSAAVAAAAARAAGAAVASARPVAGGDVNAAMRVTLDDGRELFVKHRDAAPEGMFAVEAAGLAWLAGANALRVPAGAAVDGGWLAMEWIDRGRPAPGHDERLGRGLAALHRAGAPGFGRAGGGTGFIGPLPVPDDPLPTWAEFLARRRLMPLAEAAHRAGALAAADVRALEGLCARLPYLLGPAEPPARLHGDLWAGNSFPDATGAPVLVDPAAFGGHRETDLAMMRLFGGFGDRVFAAYAEAHPLAPGHDDRVELHQLLPLLVHAALFGGGYAGSVRRIVRRFG